MSSNEVVISGAGWVGGLGEPEGNGACAIVRFRRFPDFPLDEEVPNRSDQRAMSRSMQAAAFAAGRALSVAGLKLDAGRLERTEIITAGRCVERDDDLDARILEATASGLDQSTINGLIREGLRPSLFLAQLPNLISANISIVHGVKGCSQTLLGEELAGIEAIGMAIDRISAGQSDLCLVGGVFSGDGAAIQAAVGAMDPDERPSSLGAFAAYLVLESAVSTAARGHIPMARITHHSRLSPDAPPDPGVTTVLGDYLRRTDGNGFVSIGRGGRRSESFENQVWGGLSDALGAHAPIPMARTIGALFEAAAPALVAMAADALMRAGAPKASSGSEAPATLRDMRGDAMVASFDPEGFGSLLVLETANA